MIGDKAEMRIGEEQRHDGDSPFNRPRVGG